LHINKVTPPVSKLALAKPVVLSDVYEGLFALLRTKGLSIKDLDDKKKEEIRAMLHDLHAVRGVSLGDIAKMIGNKTSGYTSWLCRQLGVEARPFEEARLKGIREKRRKFERKPFDGTDEDKAYLLGLKRGDLSVSRPWKDVVRVSTSTTHSAMADLLDGLFGKYGHVYRYARYKNDTGTYEWNLNVILDASFDFLTWTDSEVWAWIELTMERQLGYIAGFLDAEGHIGISRIKKSFGLIVSLYNTDRSLLLRIKASLRALGFSPLGPYLDKHKGTKTSKFGIERKKDYLRIALARIPECRALLTALPLRHPEKCQRKGIAVSLSAGQKWSELGPIVQSLRRSVKAERDAFVDQARIAVEGRRSSQRLAAKPTAELS
jgi:LAGLIDADG DNA endonuclease family protein